MSDERVKRIKELSQLKASDFTLRGERELTQGHLEEWGDAMAAYDLNLESGANLARLRRIAFASAVKCDWYSATPLELAEEDFLLLPPALIMAQGNQVMSLYNSILEPDESFT